MSKVELANLSKMCEHYHGIIATKLGKSGVMNILEFTLDKNVGLGFELYPMQVLIFKLFFNMSLSESLEENTIIIPDQYNEIIIHELTEKETVTYLHGEGKLNLSLKEYEKAGDFVEILFFIGRRGSKTTMISIIYCYLIYLLIKLQNPHKFFNVNPAEAIGFTVVSNTEDGAIRQFNSIKQMVTNAPFFTDFIAGAKGKEFYLKTPAYIHMENGGVSQQTKGNIVIVASAATGKSRGSANLGVAMDEYCHYRDSSVKNKAKTQDVAIYEALVPSVAGFVDNKGKAYGKSFVMSSPNGKRGDGYRRYVSSFSRKDVLMISTPSHFVNPRLASAFIRKMYEESYNSASQEYGAEFLDVVGNYIRNPHLLRAAVNKLLPNSIKNAKNKGIYNLSVDLAQSGDGLTFTVTHKEARRSSHLSPEEPKDYEGLPYEKLLSKEGIVAIDYYLKIEPEDLGGVISHKIIIGVFAEIYKHFNIEETTIDQWNYQVFSELLEEAGIVNMDTVTLYLATEISNSLAGKTFSRLLAEGRLMFPETFDTDGTFEEFVALVEYKKSKGLIKVAATGTGVDDMYSSMSRAIVMSEYKGAEQTLMASGLGVKAEDIIISSNINNDRSPTTDIQDLINQMVERQKTTVKIKQWDKDD